MMRAVLNDKIDKKRRAMNCVSGRSGTVTNDSYLK